MELLKNGSHANLLPLIIICFDVLLFFQRFCLSANMKVVKVTTTVVLVY